MCGFAALLEKGREFSPDLLSKMDRDLLHRGPDSGGIYSKPGVGLVFRRLAILDTTDSADQPMSDPGGRYTLVFNGEIYNFKSLRQRLEGLGYFFQTNGDTEVLLHGFAHWGENVVEYLEGMYAFVLVDHSKQMAFAARDPLGIKPLYMTRQGSLTAFASEMRPLHRLREYEVDEDALSELLLFRFAAGRLSNLKEIERIPSGTMIRIDLSDNSHREHRFANVLDTFQPTKATDEERSQTISNGIRQSVSDHLISDVGYTVQLSGGIDSSIVTALATEFAGKPVHTYGIGLGDTPHDESEYRQQVVSQTGAIHHEISMDGNAFADALPRAVSHMEGPSPHLGCVLLMLLCDEIKKQSKVVLTGEGADELFGGYARYGSWRDLKKHEKFAHCLPSFMWPLLKHYSALRIYENRDAAVYATVLHDYLPLMTMFPGLIPKPAAREAASGRFRDFRDRLMAVDQTAYLESLLLRQDKMAMAASVEARVPFAHFPLTRKINQIPQNARVPGGTTKPLLKTFARKYFNDDFVNRRKVGLTLPLDDWLADPKGLGRYLDILTEPNCKLSAYGDKNSLEQIVAQFRNGDRRQARILTHLINIELWLRTPRTSAAIG